MRYLTIYRPERGEEGGAPSPEHMAAMGKLIEESKDPMVYLHGGYDNTLPKIEEALDVSAATNQFISNSLKKKTVRRCRRCGQGLPDLHKHPICEPCFAMRFERND